MYYREKPYNALPLLPPDVQLETTRVLRKTIRASRALAELNGAIINLPNPQLFLDSIHLQEAKGSSAIENIITTNDDLYKALVAEKKYNNTASKEVISYKEALWYGLKELEVKPFISTNLCIEIVRRIKKNEAGIRTTPGTTLSNSAGEVIYTPPTGEKTIRDLMANLEKFINTPQPYDPLIKMAIMHYQFEAIHPFADGNGRTGRILLLLLLKMEGLLDVPAIYLSEYIILHKTAYYDKLRQVTEEGAWEGWILYMMDMIEVTAQKGLIRLQRIIGLMEVMTEEIKTQVPNAYSHELIEILFRLPYSKRQYLMDAKLGTAKTVGNYLQALEDKGFLRSIRLGKEKLYLNHRLMGLLEETILTREA